jgi:hypothetical protein
MIFLWSFVLLLAMWRADTALTIEQGCTNPGRQAAQATEVCKVVPNMCRLSVWDLCHVTLLAPRIMWWLVDFFTPTLEVNAKLKFTL